VAFAAAGAIFGTTIQKQRVQDAREQASKAEGRAQKAEKKAAAEAKDAANGHALATTIKARRKARSERPERVSALGDSNLDELGS
jgi:hypothetical protein